MQPKNKRGKSKRAVLLWGDMLASRSATLSEKDETAIAMLKSLIENIEQGNITMLEGSGRVTGDTAEITLVFHGTPIIKPTSTEPA